MADASIGTPEQIRDPNYTPPLAKAVPLGIQHVLAMFVSNVTPAIIVCDAAGFGFGSNSPDFPQMIYMIQMSMLFAGIATLFQSIGVGPVGARLPIVQGTSFAFIPIMIPLVAGQGVEAMSVLMGGIVVGGLFHAVLGLFIGNNLVVLAVVSGLAALLLANPVVRTVLFTLSTAYLLYLAMRIAFAGSKIAFVAAKSEPGVMTGILLQPINPKAYAVNTALFSGFAIMRRYNKRSAGRLA